VGHYLRVLGHVGFFLRFARRSQPRLAIRKANPADFSKEDLAMLQFAAFLIVIALIAALLGFGGLAGSFVGLAKIVFFVFLVLAVLSFFGGSFFRRRHFSQ
jgi:uncharacterized membrane protein YtjA (UPF0391 family)